MIAGMTQTQAAISTEIEFTGLKIAFDLYHGGYHANDVDNLAANLTLAGNTVVYINQSWRLDDDVDVLFLTEADVGRDWSIKQIVDIAFWFAQGDKLLWGAGDSDYGGYYDPYAINNVLEGLGSIIRLDATSISDAVYNDGAAYRAAATEFGVGDPLYDTDIVGNVSEGCTAGAIFHGPCSIVAFDGTYYKDLRYGKSIFPERVWTLMTYSVNATSDDSDVSDDWQGLDLYANSTTNGLYPALVYEHSLTYDSHIVLSGEAIYSDYKYMYDQKTENGVYNNGTAFGQVIVNNLLNFLLPFPEDVGTEDTSFFALIPVVALGVIYVVMRKRK